MWLHAETPVGPAEWQDVPLVAFLSSIGGLLALEELAVHRKTWKERTKEIIFKAKQ